MKLLRLENMKLAATVDEEDGAKCHVEITIPGCECVVDLAFHGQELLIAVEENDDFKVYSTTEFKCMDSNEILENLTLVKA